MEMMTRYFEEKEKKEEIVRLIGFLWNAIIDYR